MQIRHYFMSSYFIQWYPCWKTIFRTEVGSGVKYTHLQWYTPDINNLVLNYIIQNLFHCRYYDKDSGSHCTKWLQKQLNQKMNLQRELILVPALQGQHEWHTTCGRLCVSDGESGNKSAYGGRPVSAAHHGSTSLFLSSVTSHVILYLTSGLSVKYCYSFIHHYFLSSFRPCRKYV